jgi:copper ion binding protein
MQNHTYRVTGMTCGHCEAAVRSEVGGIDGVESVDVQLDTGELVVRGSAEVTDEAVLAAVEEAGYDAVRVG